MCFNCCDIAFNDRLPIHQLVTLANCDGISILSYLYIILFYLFILYHYRPFDFIIKVHGVLVLY